MSITFCAPDKKTKFEALEKINGVIDNLRDKFNSRIDAMKSMRMSRKGAARKRNYSIMDRLLIQKIIV